MPKTIRILCFHIVHCPHFAMGLYNHRPTYTNTNPTRQPGKTRQDNPEDRDSMHLENDGSTVHFHTAQTSKAAKMASVVLN
jgi:hypothetical protein